MISTVENTLVVPPITRAAHIVGLAMNTILGVVLMEQLFSELRSEVARGGIVHGRKVERRGNALLHHCAGRSEDPCRGRSDVACRTAEDDEGSPLVVSVGVRRRPTKRRRV